MSSLVDKDRLNSPGASHGLGPSLWGIAAMIVVGSILVAIQAQSVAVFFLGLVMMPLILAIPYLVIGLFAYGKPKLIGIILIGVPAVVLIAAIIMSLCQRY